MFWPTQDWGCVKWVRKVSGRYVTLKLKQTCQEAFWCEINDTIDARQKAVPTGLDHAFTHGPSFDLNPEATFESWVVKLLHK
jgi:hypothetical protein